MNPLRPCRILLAALLTSAFPSAVCGAAGIVTLAINDAVVIDEDGDATFDTLLNPERPDRLHISAGQPEPGESRVLLSFDISGQTDQLISGGEIEFFIDLVSDSSDPIDIYGFAGDGSLDLADADRPGELLGSYVPGLLDIGTHRVGLDGAALSRLLTPGLTNLEVRFQASDGWADTSIDKVTPLFTSSAPMLMLTPVPEPASVLLLVAFATGSMGRQLSPRSRSNRKG